MGEDRNWVSRCRMYCKWLYIMGHNRCLREKLNILDEPTFFFYSVSKFWRWNKKKTTKNCENYWNPRSCNCDDQKAMYYLKKNMVQGDLFIFLLFMKLVEKFYWNRIKQILSLWFKGSNWCIENMAIKEVTLNTKLWEKPYTAYP